MQIYFILFFILKFDSIPAWIFSKKRITSTLNLVTFNKISHLFLYLPMVPNLTFVHNVRDGSIWTNMDMRKDLDIRLSISRSWSVSHWKWPRFKVHLSPGVIGALARLLGVTFTHSHFLLLSRLLSLSIFPYLKATIK